MTEQSPVSHEDLMTEAELEQNPSFLLTTFRAIGDRIFTFFSTPEEVREARRNLFDAVYSGDDEEKIVQCLTRLENLK